MTPALSTATLVNGLVLGWSVAWPPGPVNAEMIRRGLLPASKHGGFWAAWLVGLGACTGDFVWALAVSAGAGALINTPTVRFVLGIISLGLLLFLAGVFALGAWRTAKEHRAASVTSGDREMPKERRAMNGYALGLMFTLTSPWNIGFWLAVIGSQSDKLSGSFAQSLSLAASVVLGAMAWGCVLSVAVKLGAHIFSRPGWQIGTQVLTALVMLYFAARLIAQLLG
jgi:threonine/homoserine/homoserine lactone efflux protein